MPVKQSVEKIEGIVNNTKVSARKSFKTEIKETAVEGYHQSGPVSIKWDYEIVERDYGIADIHVSVSPQKLSLEVEGEEGDSITQEFEVRDFDVVYLENKGGSLGLAPVEINISPAKKTAEIRFQTSSF